MKHYKRGFLNKGEGMAAFEASVSYDEDSVKDWDEYKCIDGDFSITDCSRKISLSFYATNAKAAKNSLHKVDTLIAQLQDFRSKLVEGYVLADFVKKEDE